MPLPESSRSSDQFHDDWPHWAGQVNEIGINSTTSVYALVQLLQNCPLTYWKLCAGYVRPVPINFSRHSHASHIFVASPRGPSLEPRDSEGRPDTLRDRCNADSGGTVRRFLHCARPDFAVAAALTGCSSITDMSARTLARPT